MKKNLQEERERNYKVSGDELHLHSGYEANVISYARVKNLKTPYKQLMN